MGIWVLLLKFFKRNQHFDNISMTFCEVFKPFERTKQLKMESNLKELACSTNYFGVLTYILYAGKFQTHFKAYILYFLG